MKVEFETDTSGWDKMKEEKNFIASIMMGMDKAMSEMVKEAKNNHTRLPGHHPAYASGRKASDKPIWYTRTAKAEGSVQIVQPSKRISSNEIEGTWGSPKGSGAPYVIWLEIKRGGFLRWALDTVMPDLNDYIWRAHKARQKHG